MTDKINSLRDPDLGDVMTLGKMYKTADAVAFLRDRFDIPDVTVARLTRARKRGEILATVFGQSTVYAERDLIAWVASLYGNSVEYRSAMADAHRGNTHAAKKKV